MRRTTLLAFVAAMSVAACIPYGDVWFHFGGTVRDPSGAPVEGVVVRIVVDGAERARVVSSSDGRYKFFEHSCPCDFSLALTAEKLGYENYTFKARGRQANRLSAQDIVLRPSSNSALHRTSSRALPHRKCATIARATRSR
jgi:hypothetical protein